MSEINGAISISINHFVTNVYVPNKKPILFWDTCSLLEIIRFLYRKGDVNSYRILNKINGLIQSDDLHSIASFLTVQEWNDHQQDVINEIENSLIKTGTYHKNTIDTINEINTTTYQSERIDNKNLLNDLERLADDIISKTHFIESAEIADKALQRVALKIAPSNKKNEFKDCAVWETMILLSERINNVNQPGDNQNKIFYSVNTDDFVDKSREPKQFYARLLTEASVVDLICCSKLDEVNNKI
ncbi:PIN domain-containing protein [Psychroserpens sp. XS_ASV72]|uniref:PIN domain-containing protein n=1 Tax=Psychroserpens sp. XS_ASV72 TaxID=3241293 RepID=UPI003514CDE9